MPSIIQLILVLALFVFTYHYERNGNPVQVSGFISRLIWAGSFALGYLALTLTHTDPLLAFLYALFSLGAIYIPHAWVQNMGDWPNPQKRWPGFFLPNLTQSQWDAMPHPQRVRHDFLGMGGVGFFRGLAVFGAPLIAAIFLPVQPHIFGPLIGWGLTTVGQPMAYLIGKQIPFSFWSNAPKSTEWGEFLVGVSWFVALVASITL